MNVLFLPTSKRFLPLVFTSIRGKTRDCERGDMDSDRVHLVKIHILCEFSHIKWALSAIGLNLGQFKVKFNLKFN